VTGKPLARTDKRLKLPATLIVLTNHGSSFCIKQEMYKVGTTIPNLFLLCF
jgi:hypothetical protein